MPELSSQAPTQSTPTQLPEAQPTPQPSKHFPRPLILGLLLIILALSVTLAYLLYNQSQTNQTANINSYQECVAAGNGQVNLMYPPQCTTPDGRTFTDPTADPVEPPAQPDQSQLEDPTAKWQTYHNSKYNFQFRYPPDWEVDRAQGSTDNFSDEELSFMDHVSMGKLIIEEDRYIGVSFSAKPSSCQKYITDSNCLNQLWESRKAAGYSSQPEIETIKINDLPAIKFADKVFDYNQHTIVFVYNGIEYNFSYSGDNSEQVEIASQILSTFEFLD